MLWDGGHIKFWSVNILTRLPNEFGFDVVESRGSGSLPYPPTRYVEEGGSLTGPGILRFGARM